MLFNATVGSFKRRLLVMFLSVAERLLIVSSLLQFLFSKYPFDLFNDSFGASLPSIESIISHLEATSAQWSHAHQESNLTTFSTPFYEARQAR